LHFGSHPGEICKNIVDALRNAGHPAQMVEDSSDLMSHADTIARRTDGGVAWP